ncbi:hypothetical protein ABPG74_013891 [Tetrahymena malaccensis]
MKSSANVVFKYQINFTTPHVVNSICVINALKRSKNVQYVEINFKQLIIRVLKGFQNQQFASVQMRIVDSSLLSCKYQDIKSLVNFKNSNANIKWQQGLR